jgi:hypothetical protein
MGKPGMHQRQCTPDEPIAQSRKPSSLLGRELCRILGDEVDQAAL